MIVTSPSPNIDIPNISVTEHILRHAARLGDKPALIDGPSGRTLTYRGLADGIRRAATGLTQRGFTKGDVLAIYAPNIPEYAIVFGAVAWCGGINTTINPLYTPDELARQLNDCKAKFLVTVPDFLDSAKAAVAGTEVTEIFILGGTEGATPFETLMDNNGDAPAASIDPQNDLLVLPYSSGTTGLPKGVMLTHANVVSNLCQCDLMEGFDGFAEHDVVIGVLPFFHIYGMVVIMMLTLAAGGTVVSMPRFDLEAFLKLIETHKVTVAPLVPPIVLGLAKHPAVDKFDLSSIRLVFSGAAPLGGELAQAVSDRLHCPVVQGYGMTEASPVTHLTPINSGIPPSSIGWVVPNTEVKIIDLETGAPLSANEEGEVCIRGPQIMRGYLNRPEETAGSIDPDGWYHSGDVGYFDDTQAFYIVDRVKELIKYKGMQVAPAELEALLLTHPAILDVAVIPKPDEEAGEIPKSYIVLKDDASSQLVSADEIMSFVAGKVAPHKRIREIQFTDAIPKSASGKILRRELITANRA